MRALLLLLALAGCTTVDRVPGPDGETHYSITCKRSITNCYEKAAELCRGGYTTADKTDESGYVQNVGTARRYTMLIKCK